MLKSASSCSRVDRVSLIWCENITVLISVNGDLPDTQSHDAEMWGWDGDVSFIKSHHGGSCDGGPFEYLAGVLGPNTTHATVLLAHRYGRVQINGDEFDKEVCDDCLFELNDAADNVAPGSNRDLYLAFNRAVNSEEPGFDGYGVCSAKLSWVCNVANP